MKMPTPADLLPLVDELEACCPAPLSVTISEDEAVLAAKIFKAISEPARVRLLSMIAGAGDAGACVCELTEPLNISQPTVSHHLRILHEAGLLSRERRGTWVYYAVRQDSLAAVARTLRV